MFPKTTTRTHTHTDTDTTAVPVPGPASTGSCTGTTDRYDRQPASSRRVLGSARCGCARILCCGSPSFLWLPCALDDERQAEADRSTYVELPVTIQAALQHSTDSRLTCLCLRHVVAKLVRRWVWPARFGEFKLSNASCPMKVSPNLLRSSCDWHIKQRTGHGGMGGNGYQLQTAEARTGAYSNGVATIPISVPSGIAGWFVTAEVGMLSSAPVNCARFTSGGATQGTIVTWTPPADVSSGNHIVEVAYATCYGQIRYYQACAPCGHPAHTYYQNACSADAGPPYTRAGQVTVTVTASEPEPEPPQHSSPPPPPMVCVSGEKRSYSVAWHLHCTHLSAHVPIKLLGTSVDL